MVPERKSTCTFGFGSYQSATHSQTFVLRLGTIMNDGPSRQRQRTNEPSDHMVVTGDGKETSLQRKGNDTGNLYIGL